MRFACCKTKATDSHSEFSEFVVSLLTAFPQQQCLRERVSMLLYKYIACLVHLFVWTVIFQLISRIRDSKCICVTVPRKLGRVVTLAYSEMIRIINWLYEQNVDILNFLFIDSVLDVVNNSDYTASEILPLLLCYLA
jgi:hypothetical protein